MEDRWGQVEALYQAARDPMQRDRVLAAADPELRREVEALLAQDGHAGETTVTMVGVGTQLGRYVIEAPLGKGGMGEVFRARDTRLERNVAIKVSNAQFSERFEREARAISALNHPHICTLYDVGPNYLVMELVEGETLAARLKKGSLSIEQTLQFGGQIADALAAAHAKGITHRDLKPGNIMLARNGVKVLDFGLAKMQGEELTLSNVVMGTPAYMAPEQLEGKEADARSDIYSLGLVLYEMAAGKRAMHGQIPPLDSLPEKLRHVVERCLALDSEERWQAAGDVKAILEWSGKNGHATPLPSKPRRIAKAWPVLVGALLAMVAAVVWLRSDAPPANTYSFHPFATEAAEENQPSWSPDGKTIAYVAEVEGVRQVFTKSLDSPIPAQITKSATSCANPFWSPDGSRIYYLAGGLWTVGAAGGEPQSMLTGVQAAAVSVEKRFAYIRGPGGSMSLWIAAPSAPEPVKYQQAPFPSEFARSATLGFSRDGLKLAVLMERASPMGFTTELWILPFPSGTPERVLESLPFAAGFPQRGVGVSWMPDNRHLVWDSPRPGVPGNHLYLVDTKRRTISPITSGTGNEWAPSVSPDGEKIAFSTGGIDFDVVQVSLEGLEIRTLLGTASREQSPSWSPGGRQFAYVGDSSGGPELWVRSIQDQWANPLLKQGTPGIALWYALERPSFSPDGSRIAFGADGSRHAIWLSPAAGGRPVPIDSESDDQHGAAWSPDGTWIAYQRFRQGKWELVKTPMGGGQPVRLADASPGGGDTAWSPTGEWVAFAMATSVQLISADGKLRKEVGDRRPDAFGFSKDGSQLFVIRRAPTSTWEFVAYDIASGKQRRRGELLLPLSAAVSGFSLNPDGKSFITSVGVPKFDIWYMDGLKIAP